MFKPAVKPIRKFSQISIQMFAGDMGVSPSDPGLEPCDDPVNMRKDINGPLSAREGNLTEIDAFGYGAIKI